MNIKTLLNKKTWTGQEIGKALIATLADDVRHRGQAHTPLLTQEDFERMLDSLKTEPQIGAYLVYQKIYSSLVDGFNREQSYEQQYLHGYYRYIMQLEEIQQADHALKAVEQYPLILSKSQYDRILQEQQQAKRSIKITFYEILFDYLEWCIANEENAPANIRKALEACRKEPAANKRILDNYCEDLGLGYYRLPDGTESRNCSSEEWQQATREAWIEHHADLKPAIKRVGLEAVVREYNQARMLQTAEAVFKGEEAVKDLYHRATGKSFNEDKLGFSAADLVAELLDNLGGSRTGGFTAGDLTREDYCKWIVEDLPDDVSKYDIISEPDLLLYYSDGLADTDLTPEEQLAEFKADYPKLFSALQAELKKLLKLKRVSPTKQYTWGELADLGIADYRLYVEVSEDDIIDHYCSDQTEKGKQDRLRAAYRGIAIIAGRSLDIDRETGDYIEPVNPYTEINNLDNITIEEAEQIDTYLSILMEPAARYLLAYNALLDMLADYFDIPDLKDIKPDLSGLEDKARCFNNILYLAYTGMSGSPEEKSRKRQLLQDYFRVIDWESYKPTEENIAAVGDMLSRLTLSRQSAEKLESFDKYLEILMREGADYEE